MEGTLTLETKLDELKADFKALWEQAKSATGARLTELQNQLTAVQSQADAIDSKLAMRHGTDATPNGLEMLLKENDGIGRLLRDRKGSAVIEIPTSLLERKTVIDSGAVGSSTSGVLTIDRTPGIVQEARQQLTVRDALTSRPTSMQIVDFVKVNSPLSPGSVQVESQLKPENAVTFQTSSERVQTLVSTIPASRQVLDDFSELQSFLTTGLRYYVNLREEAELLFGGGGSTDLHGLYTQATAYNTALNPLSGWQRVDQIARTIEQLMIAKEIQPSFIVLHPQDYWSVRLTKDSQGRYLSNTMDVFWGLTPIPTVSMSQGVYLVGSGDPAAAEIRDRMQIVVEISTEHQDFFAKNLVMIRCEKRLALCVYRTGSYIGGTFSTSP